MSWSIYSYLDHGRGVTDNMIDISVFGTGLKIRDVNRERIEIVVRTDVNEINSSRYYPFGLCIS